MSRCCGRWFLFTSSRGYSSQASIGRGSERLVRSASPPSIGLEQFFARLVKYSFVSARALASLRSVTIQIASALQRVLYPNRSVEQGCTKIPSLLMWTTLLTVAVKMDDFIFWFIFRCGKGCWNRHDRAR